MLERIGSIAKVSVLLTLFFLPVLAAQYRTQVNTWWQTKHRVEAPRGRNSLAHFAGNDSSDRRISE
jgi:hypothetical protein